MSRVLLLKALAAHLVMRHRRRCERMLRALAAAQEPVIPRRLFVMLCGLRGGRSVNGAMAL